MGKKRNRTKKKDEPVVEQGIDNVGNTCYINATLQVLRPHLNLSRCTPGSMGAQLGKLFKNEITAGKFIDGLSIELKRDLRRQDDSGMFLRDFLRLLSEDAGVTDELQLRSWTTRYECKKCSNIYLDERSKNALMFEVVLSSAITSVTEALQGVLFPDQRPCSECAEKRTDGSVIFETRSAFILSISDPYLSRYTFESSISVFDREFSLHGCVVHHGSSQKSGHYTALCKKEQEWYEYNDASSSLSSLESIAHGKPVVLLYIKQNQSDTHEHNDVVEQNRAPDQNGITEFKASVDVQSPMDEERSSDLLKELLSLYRKKQQEIAEIEHKYSAEIERLEKIINKST